MLRWAALAHPAKKKKDFDTNAPITPPNQTTHNIPTHLFPQRQTHQRTQCSMAAAVVVGGAGALGAAIVRALRRKALQQQQPLPRIISVDFRPCPVAEEEEKGKDGGPAVVTHSVVLPSSGGGEWHEAGERVLEELRALDSTGRGTGYGSVFHAAGGWAGGFTSVTP